MAQKLDGLDGYRIHIGHVDGWQELIRDSEFALCPRGRGATTSRVFEALQAETIPIVIWWSVRTRRPPPADLACKHIVAPKTSCRVLFHLHI